MKNYSIITSFNKRIYEAESQQIVDDMNKNHLDTKFYIYHENSFEKSIGNEEINFNNKRENLFLYDVFLENNWLQNFLETSPFKDCSKYGFPGCLPTHPDHWKRNSIYWFRKVAALKHCVDIVDTNYLIWLDADTVFRTDRGHTNGFDKPFFDYTEKFDCSVIKRPDYEALETGIIVFNLKKQGKQGINDWLEYYTSLKPFKHDRWDDGYILTKVMEQTENKKYSFGSLRHGIELENQVYRYVRHFKGPLVEIRDKEKGI